MEYLNFKYIILFAKFNKYFKYIITMVKIPLIRDCSMFWSPQQRRSCRCSLQPPGWLKPPSQPELFSASITLNINCLNTFISNKLYFLYYLYRNPGFKWEYLGFLVYNSIIIKFGTAKSINIQSLTMIPLHTKFWTKKMYSLTKANYISNRIGFNEKT